MAAEIKIVPIVEVKQEIGKKKISFRSNTVNTMVNYIEAHPVPANILRKRIKQDTTGLRNAARQYYNFANQMVKELIQIRDTATNCYRLIHQKNNKTITQYFISMKKIKNFDIFLKKLVIKTEEFSNKILVDFLKQEPTQMIYNPTVEGTTINNFSSSNIVLYKVSPTDILKISGQEGQNWSLRLSASQKELENLESGTVSRFLQTDYYSEQEIKNLQGVSDEVLARYKQYKNNTDKILYTWGPGNKKNTRRWKEYLLTNNTLNVGNIVEAYVRCVVNRTYFLASMGLFNCWNQNSKQLPYQLSVDAFLRSLDQNDNVSGFLERDTKNLAVKAGRAQTMGIQPALDIAYKILSLKTDDINKIQDIIFEKFDELHARGQIQNHLQEINDSVIQNMLPY